MNEGFEHHGQGYGYKRQGHNGSEIYMNFQLHKSFYW